MESSLLRKNTLNEAIITLQYFDFLNFTIRKEGYVGRI